MNNNYPNHSNQQNRPAGEDKAHNPNPFDFVPFRNSPITKKEIEFDALGEMMSGYFEIQIKALTAMHVVGAQKSFSDGRYSKHYRQNGLPCIPAATIRGCLRAFIEALTAGWVSQAVPKYEKEFNKRHIAFAAFEKVINQEPAIKPEYKPRVMLDAELDVASYLFGLVVEKERGSKASHEELARKSRVWIEDAYFLPDHLDPTTYWCPDVKGEAFMGGPKPSASSWWYMEQKTARLRNTKIKNKNTQQVEVKKMAEFMGETFRGRKFYFHQNPEKCTAYYDQTWDYPKGSCIVDLESFKPGESTDTFRIYVNCVPQKLLILLALSLFPGSHIRHKLGYGKMYGYGSFEFVLQGANFRAEKPEQRIPPPLTNALEQIRAWQALAWDEAGLKKEGIDTLIDWQALNQLALILSWDHLNSLIFTYPPFAPGYFQMGIKYDVYERARSRIETRTPTERDIAESLYPLKKTIDFRLYQEKAKDWDRIKQRKP